MCWGLWSVRKRPNAVFPEREQEKKSRDPQRESTKEPPRSRQGAAKEPSRSTLLDPMAPGMLKKEKKEQKEQPGDMGRGMRTGSHTPWAQGPANNYFPKEFAKFEVQSMVQEGVHNYWRK